MKSIILCLVVYLAATSTLSSHEIEGVGVFGMNVSRRSECETTFISGDFLAFNVSSPGKDLRLYASAHLEFKAENGNWLPVPLAKTDYASRYRSGRYPGVRDYVLVEQEEAETKTRSIPVLLFIPYQAADFRRGQSVELRYVLRLWDKFNRETKKTALPGVKVKVEAEGDRMRLICAEAPHDKANFRYFDAKGQWFEHQERDRSN